MAGLADHEEVRQQGEHADRSGDQRVAEDAAPVRDRSGRNRHTGRDSSAGGLRRAASRCACHRWSRGGSGLACNAGSRS